jgi:nucleoside-diphosphate-sugar epimerase
MPRILITGAGGMVGSHLLERMHAAAPGDALGSYFRPTVRLDELSCHLPLAELDVRDTQAVFRMVAEQRPARIFHLAAQSLPTVSWIDPLWTMQTNVNGTINLFEAVLRVRATVDAEYDPMIVVACSSAQYGASLTPQNVPIGEDVPPLPLHPYGVSKVAQDLLAFQYWRNDRIRCIRARIFNTTGPRKRDDVVSDFAARIARITRDGGPLRVGNLEARRAIMDVRDLVSALMLLAEHGEPGEAYNICGDTAWRIGDLIPVFERLAGIGLRLAPDPALFRPSDEAVILGRNTKLKERTGWQPAVGIEATLKAVLDYELAHLPLPGGT